MLDCPPIADPEIIKKIEALNGEMLGNLDGPRSSHNPPDGNAYRLSRQRRLDSTARKATGSSDRFGLAIDV